MNDKIQTKRFLKELKEEKEELSGVSEILKGDSKKEKVFSISLSLGDKVYKSKGANFLEALQTLKMPEKIMSKAILTISDGELSYDMDYLPLKTKRLFWKNAQPLLAKQFNMLVRKVKQT